MTCNADAFVHACMIVSVPLRVHALCVKECKYKNKLVCALLGVNHFMTTLLQ